MNPQDVPDPAVRRLSLYLRELEQFAARGAEVMSSRQLAETLRLTPAQVRRDLAYFGQFGRPGKGYPVAALAERLRHILGTDREWNVILVGVGDLGQALLRYRGFRKKGFRLVAAFDVAPNKVGKTFGHVPVFHVKDLERVVREHGVRLAILTVPAEAAPELAERLAEAGVMGVLNFAPAALHPPAHLAVAPVDLAAHLERLSFEVAGRLRNRGTGSQERQG